MVDTKKLKNFEFGNATDVGRVREQNEDYLGYFECINGHVFVVCDGMGGHVGGATASRLAVDAVREYMENHYFDMPQDALREAIQAANDAVYLSAAENPQLSGMGTTIVMVIVRDDKVYYAHVGDSRIYIHSDGKLNKLTRDHSFVQTLVDEGLLKEEEMESHPRRNEILRALGVRSDVEIELCTSPVKPANGDILLLCTDGLNSMISDVITESVLNEDIPIQHKAMKLTQLANEAGGFDNLTVQLVHFYNVVNKKSDFVPASKAVAVAADKGSNIKKPFLSKPMRKKVLYVVVIAAILAICYFLWDMFGSTGNPEPLGSNPGKDTLTEEVRDTTKPVVQQQQQQTIKPSGDTTWISYTIKSGDVLGKISTRFNVRLAVLMKKNKLKSDQVKLGDQLWVPVREEHNVVAGENIDVLSKKYQIAKERILAANGFKTAAELKAGAKIVIPF